MVSEFARSGCVGYKGSPIIVPTSCLTAFRRIACDFAEKFDGHVIWPFASIESTRKERVSKPMSSKAFGSTYMNRSVPATIATLLLLVLRFCPAAESISLVAPSPRFEAPRGSLAFGPFKQSVLSSWSTCATVDAFAKVYAQTLFLVVVLVGIRLPEASERRKSLAAPSGNPASKNSMPWRGIFTVRVCHALAVFDVAGLIRRLSLVQSGNKNQLSGTLIIPAAFAVEMGGAALETGGAVDVVVDLGAIKSVKQAGCDLSAVKERLLTQ